MAEKYWTEGGDKGVDNSHSDPEPINLKLSTKYDKKTDQTQYIDWANKKLYQLTTYCLVAKSYQR